MAATASRMLALGTLAPAFKLQGTEGETVTLESSKGRAGLLVMFICNHCPYVIHIQKALTLVANSALDRGIGVVAINSNDVKNYPDDSPEKMRTVKRELGFKFPYVFDETQGVAKAYKAACTPDFFLFDSQLKLVYRGQFDDSRPRSSEPVTGKDLESAIQNLAEGKPVSENQKASLGCNIKWKPGNEP